MERPANVLPGGRVAEGLGLDLVLPLFELDDTLVDAVDGAPHFADWVVCWFLAGIFGDYFWLMRFLRAYEALSGEGLSMLLSILLLRQRSVIVQAADHPGLAVVFAASHLQPCRHQVSSSDLD